MKSLEKIIAPVTLKIFEKECWRKSALHLSDNKFLQSLINVADVNEFLGRPSLQWPHVRIVSNGPEITKDSYTLDDQSFFNLLDRTAVFRLFKEGHTIVINGVAYHFDKVRQFIRQFEEEYGVKEVTANIYITPPNSKGFAPHFDSHEVFAFQIAGTKNWNVYNMPYVSPPKEWNLTRAQTNDYINGKPEVEVTLLPGDVLYIPQGVVHDAYTTIETSIHLTIGVHPVSRLELVTEIINRMRFTDFFREPAYPLLHEFNFDDCKIEFLTLASNIIKEVLESSSVAKPNLKASIKYPDTRDMFESILVIEAFKSIKEFTSYNVKFLKRMPLSPFEMVFLDHLDRWQRDKKTIGPLKKYAIIEFKELLKALVYEGVITIKKANKKSQ